MNVHHIAITVNNLAESSAFYQEIFGFRAVKTFEREDLNGKAVFLQLNGFSLELWEFADMKENSDNLKDLKIRGIRHLAFQVEDVDETINGLKSKGLAVSEPKMGASGHRYAFTTDPNGVALELYEK